MVTERSRGRWGVVAVLVAVLVAGCKEERKYEPAPSADCFPVSGTVRAGGKPAAGARVVFHPLPVQPGQRTFEVFTDAEGKFQPTTNRTGDGLPPGKYDVTITWPEIPTDDPEVENDRLRGRYNNRQKPPFAVEVKREPNTIPPFDVK